MKTIGRIEKWGQVTQLQGKNGTMSKCEVVIKDIGGDYADTYVATVWGEEAKKNIAKGTPVAAKLRFFTHKHEGRTYQDIVADEIISLAAKEVVF
ncbi:hypothetical protein CIK99_10485 [Prevotella sp. P5-92]|uniref:DUF3127 domain-containing protein n=1 Tax=Prevotella sp. P5-92 TaxID=2024222 RepID=UPI000B9620E2|nr:DUF3127 domain-containing protein [Prevotella sp. P5-92]OYP55583.1 hypothetical protein CIK99_10485 [Prevotella sp. P5-92]